MDDLLNVYLERALREIQAAEDAKIMAVLRACIPNLDGICERCGMKCSVSGCPMLMVEEIMEL